ncbi:hypothetical protein D1007_03443 [Hordeum vulgare]|nr:hypothetical protein D1007_03443 [Hordeum vulgare]
MGPTTTPAGVTFLAVPYTTSSERVAHDLVMRYDAFDCINDNACRLEDVAFPVEGSIISFSSHCIFVSVVVEHYPTDVADDDALPPAGGGSLSSDVDDLCRRVEVLTASSAGGASGHRTLILAVVDSLRNLVPLMDDRAVATQELDKHRQQLLHEVEALEAT